MTDIFNSATPEFFINMKSVPDKNSVDRKAFVLEEKRKGREGINVNGVYIPGNLYFHLNFYRLSKDIQDNQGKTLKVIDRPDFRDVDWIIFNDYHKATIDNKIYTLFGLRQIGKSEIEVSLCLRELSLYANTEAIALFSSAKDKDTFVKKARLALEHGEKFIFIPNIDKDWSKEEIRFGFTKSNNDIDLRGLLYIYLTKEGKNVQVASGKALKNGSHVYYRDKIGEIQDCKVGDRIYGRDGKLATIKGVYPQGIVDLYEIKLHDKRKVVCSGDHLWTVYRTDKTKNRKETVTTEQLLTNYKRIYFNSKINKEISVNRYVLPNIESVEFPYKEVLIDPYYLGLWQGDGTTKCPSQITTIDEEIVEYLKNFSIKIDGVLKNKDKITYTISNKTAFKHSPLIKSFQKYNLIGNKHIPDDYLFNSKEVRLEFLKGLMDSDGTIDKNGKSSICFSNKILADQTAQLIRSLGINCTISEKETKYFSKKYNRTVTGKLAYVIYIGNTKLPIFKLTRKLNRQILKSRPSIGIESIKKVESNYATCIKVDNEDSLFLTNNFIPTHNTPTFALFDEIAKSPYRLVYEALEPALQDDFGNLRCAPIKTFTGGEVDKSVDAENLVTFPNSDKQMIYDVDGKEIGGRFLSGLYRKDCKVDTNFSDFIGKKTGTWLDTYNIRVSDFEKAKQRIEKDLDAARKLPDPRPLILKRIFNPLSIADVFLTENKNPFDVQALERHKDFLLRNPVGTAVDIYKDANGVIQIAASKKPVIQEYPVRDKMIELDAPIVIYEHPKYERFYALHVMGFDPIHQDESTGDSLASVYIMRRNHTDIQDPFRDVMVASYSARHKSLTKGYMKNVELLQEYYNCQILHEAGPNSVFTYFDKILKTDVLMDTFQLQKSINDKTKATSSKGLPSTVANNAARLQVLINYLEEDLGNGVLGYTRILDPLLIDELIAFDGMGKGTRNTDRVDAFTLALIQITSLERFNQLRPFVTHLEIKDTPKKKQAPLRNSMGIVNRKGYRNSMGI